MGENLEKTEFKESFGEVNTPYSLADEMISLFPEEFFIDPNKKLKVVPIDYLYPDYIRLNKEKYSEWII